MSIRIKHLSRWFSKPWLGIPLGLWILVLVFYYWWMYKISVLENQNKLYKAHLKVSQEMILHVTAEPVSTYQVPVISDTVGTLCETIHIAIVCMGKCTRSITPMLKSILHHRQNPLHFHYIVDPASWQVITTLMDTWDLPDVKYTCYNAQEHLSKIRWVPNSHYSGIFGLVKLVLPDILPSTLGQVLVLDTDLTFLCDVAELWGHLRNLTDDQFLGLVENESNWYLDTVLHWPAIGRGFNTGVMLLDLHKMRQSDTNWTRLWHNAVNNNLERLKVLTLADQDATNVIIKENPKIVYRLSCQYNVQMSTKSLAKSCYGENFDNVKIIHWNSPSKHNIKIINADYFKNIHQAYVNLDGNLFRKKLHRCYPPEEATYEMNNSDLCVSFREAQRTKLRTHLYYLDYSYTAIDDVDVTLVLQLSMDRLQFLERLVKYWDGPLSVAIYLSDCEVAQFERFTRDWSDTLSARTNIGYHLVFKHESMHYPVNYLRNVALENVKTPYVFLMDVDFVPMTGLYSHLRHAILLINPYPLKKCLVVAAFETQRYRASPPRNKPSLLSRLAGRGRKGTGDVAPFRLREWPRGHRATNYSRWAVEESPYEVEWQTDYEPYLVVHRSVPKYDTRFSGFGWNKVSHSVELRALRYRAVVLPGAFVVHTSHAPSLDITAFRADPAYRICLALLKHEFLDDLRRKYNVTLDSSEQAYQTLPKTHDNVEKLPDNV